MNVFCVGQPQAVNSPLQKHRKFMVRKLKIPKYRTKIWHLPVHNFSLDSDKRCQDSQIHTPAIIDFVESNQMLSFSDRVRKPGC